MVDSDDLETKIAAISPFGLRMRPELKRRVEEAARANNRSLNSEIVARLEQSFRTQGQPTNSASPTHASAQEERLSTLQGFVEQLIADQDNLLKRLRVVEMRLNKQSQ